MHRLTSLAKRGADFDGASFAEYVDQHALQKRHEICVAVWFATDFHFRIEGLFDPEATEEKKIKSKRQFCPKNGEGFMHRVIKATVGNKFYQCVEAASVAFWKCSRPMFWAQ